LNTKPYLKILTPIIVAIFCSVLYISGLYLLGGGTWTKIASAALTPTNCPVFTSPGGTCIDNSDKTGSNTNGSGSGSGGGGGNATGGSTSIAAACGKKTASQTPPKADCGKGIISTKKSANSFYKSTFFGCSGGKKDSGDNCQPACGASLKSIVTTKGTVNLSGKSGRSYEDAIGYFSANKSQYGCGTRLLLTNPKTGQAVVVVAIDAGPACWVQSGRYTLDMSWLAQKAIGDPSIVRVDVVAKTTPIGPVTKCQVANGLLSLACNAGLPIDSAGINTFVKTLIN